MGPPYHSTFSNIFFKNISNNCFCLFLVIVFETMVSFPSLPAVVTAPANRAVEAARSTIGGFTWKPALAIARPTILSVLSKIEIGTLILVDEPSGTRHIFGQKLDGSADLSNVEASATRRATTVPRVELIVKNDAFWMRVFLFGDMGFSEAYMLGDFGCQDLTSFFQVWLRRDT